MPPKASKNLRGTSSPRVLWLPRMKTRSFSALPWPKPWHAAARPVGSQQPTAARQARPSDTESTVLNRRLVARREGSSAARTIAARSAASSVVVVELPSHAVTTRWNSCWYALASDASESMVASSSIAAIRRFGRGQAGCHRRTRSVRPRYWHRRHQRFHESAVARIHLLTSCSREWGSGPPASNFSPP